VLFSVPKKKVKHAVDRNAIKRKMREAYRLHKHLLISRPANPIYFLLAYVYVANDQTTNFEIIQKKVLKGIQQINNVLSRVHF